MTSKGNILHLTMEDSSVDIRSLLPRIDDFCGAHGLSRDIYRIKQAVGVMFTALIHPEERPVDIDLEYDGKGGVPVLTVTIPGRSTSILEGKNTDRLGLLMVRCVALDIREDIRSDCYKMILTF